MKSEAVVDGVIPSYLVPVKPKIKLLGAVQGKLPQSFTLAHFEGDFSRYANPRSSTLVNFEFLKK